MYYFERKTCACGRPLEDKHTPCNGKNRTSPSITRLADAWRTHTDILDDLEITDESVHGLLDTHRIVNASIKTITCNCKEPLTKVSDDDHPWPCLWGHSTLYLACGCKLASSQYEEYSKWSHVPYENVEEVEDMSVVVSGVECRRCVERLEVDVAAEAVRGMSLNGDVTADMIDLFKSFEVSTTANTAADAAAAVAIDAGEGGVRVLTPSPK